MTEGISVFLCHFSGDKPTVRMLARRLEKDGFKPWLDEDKLMPGERWQDRIIMAVRSADAILICFSSQTAETRTYVQQEITLVLQELDVRMKGATSLRRWGLLDMLFSGRRYFPDLGTVTRKVRERNETFLIPVLLEMCPLRERLNKWHAVRLFQEGGYESLVDALRRAAEVKATLIEWGVKPDEGMI
jgi:hypothetical protein